jgi:hypothetical protein
VISWFQAFAYSNAICTATARRCMEAAAPDLPVPTPAKVSVGRTWAELRWGQLYKLNPVLTRSLKATWFQPLSL